ncbi:MAG: phytoene/squalene synthase family protein [Chitinophagia bacterium]|nr:phytoene/squalene synthase family protein [Chitinophagia bacterium]
MKALFDKVSGKCSRLTTEIYSNSFSIGVRCLKKEIRDAIYAIYGFVRFADEIVDTFHDYDKEELFTEFSRDTWAAIARGISLNPILNSFQQVVNDYKIDHELIKTFLRSMETDLHQHSYVREDYDQYIVGSAEVVGLMCLKVFTGKNEQLYLDLQEPARKLGAAFQKVNFLRDIRADYEHLGRVYFPGVDFQTFTAEQKTVIEEEIEQDFQEAYKGLMKLEAGSRFGVYVAYIYYKTLFGKIRKLPAKRILLERVRISNYRKLSLLLVSYLRHFFISNENYAL